MKKIYHILLLFFSLASCNFFSTDQLIEEDNSKVLECDDEDFQENHATVLTGRICISGAVPSKLVPSFNTKRNPQALPVVRQCVLHGQ